jgi:predicted PolB exonuclease-like 3'-5' exonuclease
MVLIQAAAAGPPTPKRQRKYRAGKELITAFCDKIAELSPQLVTFNGNSFDLPVLRYRAMVHGIYARGLSARPYFHRHTEDAIDLCDEHVKRLRVKDKTQRKIARSSSMDSHGFCAWIIRWQSEHSSCS